LRQGIGFQRGVVTCVAVLAAPVRRLRAVYARYAEAHVAPRPSGFALALLRATPALIRHALWHQPADRLAVKRALGLGKIQTQGALDGDWFDGVVQRGQGPITIVMPVHGAFDLLSEVLGRVVRHTDIPWHLVLVEDASTDARVRPWLRDWVARHPARATLLENTVNMGFVGAANRGLGFARGRAGHVVLLNTDAFVPAGWASRLLGPLEADGRVASVTPMSNDAEIFSAPTICARGSIPPGAVDLIDAVAARLGRNGPLPTAPTGVGFCMAMNRAFLDHVPQFDMTFGKGYGEEVDWCRKTQALGGRHLCQPALFVEHRGGASFGTAAKQALVTRHNAIISARYPTYDLEVQRYIAADPLLTPRMALALAHVGVAARGAVPLFVAHAMGGGAEIALSAEIADALDQIGAALVLRVGTSRRWRLELHMEGGAISAVATDDLALIHRLLGPVPCLHIVYSCGVGDTDPVTLPAAMLGLRRPGRADTVAARMHDFFPLTPSYCLFGRDGQFRGAPDPRDPAHVARRADGTRVRLDEWQAAWHGFLSQCTEIRVFSDDSRAHVLRAYSDLAHLIVVRPHAPPQGIARVLPPRRSRPVLAVLGNLNIPKGAGVLRDLALRIDAEGGGAVGLDRQYRPRRHPARIRRLPRQLYPAPDISAGRPLWCGSLADPVYLARDVFLHHA
jgi:GT2 family glycosyltransferase